VYPAGAAGNPEGMTTQRDPEDGTLVEREGVDAGSARSTAEGPLLSGGTTTGVRGDAPEFGGPDTHPAQVWAEGSGFADPSADGDDESGQDEGLID
jgi:hypothetical protein